MLMEQDRPDLVQSFLQSIRNINSKQEFMNRIHEFDSRFTEEPTMSVISEKQRSMEKLPPVAQKPKNPFRSNLEESHQRPNYRQHNLMATTSITQNIPSQYPPQQPYNSRVPNHSRSEQNFYKTPINEYQQIPSIPMNSNQYNLNQRQYDELKEQFFKPTTKPDFYKMAQEQNASFSKDPYNFHQMQANLNSVSNLDLYQQRQTPRPIHMDNRHNPFSKQ